MADRWQSVRLADIPSWARGYVRCAFRLPRTRSIWWSTSLMAPLTSILRPSGPGVVWATYLLYPVLPSTGWVVLISLA